MPIAQACPANRPHRSSVSSRRLFWRASKRFKDGRVVTTVGFCSLLKASKRCYRLNRKSEPKTRFPISSFPSASVNGPRAALRRTWKGNMPGWTRRHIHGNSTVVSRSRHPIGHGVSNGIRYFFFILRSMHHCVVRIELGFSLQGSTTARIAHGKRSGLRTRSTISHRTQIRKGYVSPRRLSCCRSSAKRSVHRLPCHEGKCSYCC